MTCVSKRVSIVVLGLCVTLGAAAQKTSYLQTTFLKVAPDKEAEFMETMRSNTPKLAHEVFATPINVVSVTISRVVYAGLPAAEYNYVQSVAFDGSPMELPPATIDEVSRKATGMSIQDYQKKLRSMSTIVGSTLGRREATTPVTQRKEGEYAQVTYYKITPGRAADYANFIQRMVLPTQAQLVKDGTNAGWAAYRVVSPSGTEAMFDAAAATYYHDMASVVPSMPVSPDQLQIAFAKALPGESFVTANDLNRDTRRAVRTELRRVVAVAYK